MEKQKPAYRSYWMRAGLSGFYLQVSPLLSVEVFG